MGSLNRATLIGQLGRDPEARALANGGKVVSFSVATSERWKDKTTAEQKERTEWHRVSIFHEQLGGIAERFLKKGSTVMVEGQIQSRKYTDKDGVERTSTEIVLQGFDAKLVLLDKAPARDGAGGGAGAAGGGWDTGGRAAGGAPKGAPTGGGWGASGSGGGSTLNDDIPFAPPID